MLSPLQQEQQDREGEEEDWIRSPSPGKSYTIKQSLGPPFCLLILRSWPNPHQSGNDYSYLCTKASSGGRYEADQAHKSDAARRDPGRKLPDKFRKKIDSMLDRGDGRSYIGCDESQNDGYSGCHTWTAVRKVQIVSELTPASWMPWFRSMWKSLHRDDPFCSKLLRGKEVKIKSVDGALVYCQNRSSNVQRRSTTQPLHCVLCMEVATVGSSLCNAWISSWWYRCLCRQ
jgi:hypothetical protein